MEVNHEVQEALSHTQIAFTPGIPREEKRALIEAFELGKVIQWSAVVPGDTFGLRAHWNQWNYLDLAGENQPELGHAHYLGGVVTWRVPEQEQVTVNYKVAIVLGGAEGTMFTHPYAVAYTEEQYLPRHIFNLLLDKDDTEHSTAFWRVKK